VVHKSLKNIPKLSKGIQVRGATLFVYMKLYDFTLYDIWLGAYFCVNFPLVEGPPGDAWEWHPFLGFEMNRLAVRVTSPSDANPCVLVNDSVWILWWLDIEQGSCAWFGCINLWNRWLSWCLYEFRWLIGKHQSERGSCWDWGSNC